MKRSSTFLILFAAATFTFLSLMIFAGPQRTNYRDFSYKKFYGAKERYHCRQNKQKSAESSGKEQPSKTEAITEN